MNNDFIETIKYKDYTIGLVYADNPDNPRTWDNLCVIYHWHRRENIGDENFRKHWDSWTEFAAEAKKSKWHVWPLYLHEHSGYALKIGTKSDFADSSNPFCGKLPQGHAFFDSGQVGFVVVKPKRIRELKVSKDDIEKKVKSEITTFEAYANGDVYGFRILDEDGELIDSCSGYYGTSEAIEEAESVIDFEIKEAEEKNKIECDNLTPVNPY